MASKGYVDQILNTLPADVRRPIMLAFEHVQDTWRLGDGARAANAQWYRFTATTPAVSGTEFSIVHGQGQPPRWIIPVLDATKPGAQLAPLSVVREADAQRVYLASSSTSAPVTVFVEF